MRPLSNFIVVVVVVTWIFAAMFRNMRDSDEPTVFLSFFPIFIALIYKRFIEYTPLDNVSPSRVHSVELFRATSGDPASLYLTVRLTVFSSIKLRCFYSFYSRTNFLSRSVIQADLSISPLPLPSAPAL